MTRYAFLCGSAPENFRQKKLCDMHDFLASEAGGAWREEDITIFPNGVHELMLECALNSAFDEFAGDGECALEEVSEENAGCAVVLLYFCTQTAPSDTDETFWLGGQELRKDVIAYYEGLAKRCGVSLQVIFDSDREMVGEDALGYEAV